jgi:hypothetical protein
MSRLLAAAALPLALPLALALALAAGCSDRPAPPDRAKTGAVDVPAKPVNGTPRARPAPPQAEPARPGAPGGLPHEATPLAEAPFDARSAQGAAQVVQTYYALIEAGRYGEARRLWGGGGDARGRTEADFAADFAAYRDYHAQVGAPGRIEGAAGSSFVAIPVQLYGRLRDGSRFRRPATVTLRRVNDVPGATAEQRRWRISDIAADAGVAG